MGELADDGTREKDHKHVFIIPNGRIDTMGVSKLMYEPDPNNPSKPLKCMDFRSSKEDEWLLYCSHNPEYLRTKFLVREYEYALCDFVSSDDDETEIKWNRAFHESDFMKNQRLFNLLKECSASQLAAHGFLQPQQAFQTKTYYQMMCEGINQDNRGFHQFEGEVPFDDIDDVPPSSAS
jgi:hypothetical protein